jgi:hypothetical protein
LSQKIRRTPQHDDHRPAIYARIRALATVAAIHPAGGLPQEGFAALTSELERGQETEPRGVVGFKDDTWRDAYEPGEISSIDPGPQLIPGLSRTWTFAATLAGRIATDTRRGPRSSWRCVGAQG